MVLWPGWGERIGWVEGTGLGLYCRMRFWGHGVGETLATE